MRPLAPFQLYFLVGDPNAAEIDVFERSGDVSAWPVERAGIVRALILVWVLAAIVFSCTSKRTPEWEESDHKTAGYHVISGCGKTGCSCRGGCLFLPLMVFFLFQLYYCDPTVVGGGMSWLSLVVLGGPVGVMGLRVGAGIRRVGAAFRTKIVR